jgi:hypothetical membrane protein
MPGRHRPSAAYPYGGIVRGIRWWGVVSAALAPVVLIGGWTAAAALQPIPFNAVTRSVSSLAAAGTPYSWVVTAALFVVGVCDVVTGLALRPAAPAGRLLLIGGGFCGMLVAAFPQPQHGSSLAHQFFASVGIVLLTIWPVAAISRRPDAPAGLRPVAGYAAAAFTAGLLAWFGAELLGGRDVGLAERVLIATQTTWPLAVMLSVLAARARPSDPLADGAD